jgi:ubiquinone/menaquinone biosynthesis C-methylase UbiE
LKQEIAISLIKKAITNRGQPQIWVDLGRGSGTFTKALAQILPSGSLIYAIDALTQKFPAIMGNNVTIEFIKADFESCTFNFFDIDGILMANSLHYVKDNPALINRLEKYLTIDRKYVIIEYETSNANQWVPFPISFNQLQELFNQFDRRKIVKVATQKSIYGQGDLYMLPVYVENHYSGLKWRKNR